MPTALSLRTTLIGIAASLAGLAVLLVVAGGGDGPASAGATTIVVDTLADPGGPDQCSLRRAIENANANAQTNEGCLPGVGADVIAFAVDGCAPDCVITLDSSLPDITDPLGLTIDGEGNVIIDGAAMFRPLTVEDQAALVLTGTTVTNGSRPSGGGIWNDGTLTLIDSAVSDSIAWDGPGGGIANGGVSTPGVLVLENSTVSGNSAVTDVIVVSPGRGAGIYNTQGASVTLIDSVVTGNTAQHDGGGVYNESEGDITIIRGTVSDNTASQGGGIYSRGAVALTGVRVTENDAANSGGGLLNDEGTLTVRHSSVSANDAAWGGGIYTVKGATTVVSTTVSENEAVLDGGGIYNDEESDLMMANSTVSGNDATGQGGGVFSTLAGATAILTNVTVTDNSAGGGGGGIYVDAGEVTLINTIVSDQQSGDDCGGEPPSSGGHNLDSDGTCDLTETGDISEGAASLGPLADNGGPTLTHALLEESDAVDAGDDAVCADQPVNGVDQRGAFRPAGKACDIGAFEFGAALPLWGDLDCDGSVVIGDALKTARYLLGLTVSQEAGCPEPGADVTVDGIDRTWGDIDCDGSVAIGDALKIARWLLGLSVSQEEGCPEIGTEVFVGS